MWVQSEILSHGKLVHYNVANHSLNLNWKSCLYLTIP